MTTELRVPDASCGHCKETIETTVSAIEGVHRAELDLDSKKLSVQHDGSVELTAVFRAVSAAGYNPETASSGRG